LELGSVRGTGIAGILSLGTYDETQPARKKLAKTRVVMIFFMEK